MIPLWNHLGQRVELDPPPISIDEWTQGEDLDPDRQALRDASENILNRTIIKLACRSMNLNLTLDALLEDGTSVIVRRRMVDDLNPLSNQWSLDKFEAEIQLLHWLKEKTGIPVPTVLAVGHSTYEFSIQERVLGATILRQWHLLSGNQKEACLSQFADLSIELFRFSVPQCIGSASVKIVNGSRHMQVRPYIGCIPLLSSAETFDNIFQYFAFLFGCKRQLLDTWTMTLEEKESARKILDEVEASTRSLLEDIDDPALLRCVFNHGDLHNENVLIDAEGNITGIVDWEINCIQPALLSVNGPQWIFAEGKSDPSFYSGQNMTTFWEESPAERRRLRTLFEEIAYNRDKEYHKCLIAGTNLRSIADWLICTHNDDPGFVRFGKWAASKLL